MIGGLVTNPPRNTERSLLRCAERLLGRLLDGFRNVLRPLNTQHRAKHEKLRPDVVDNEVAGGSCHNFFRDLPQVYGFFENCQILRSFGFW